MASSLFHLSLNKFSESLEDAREIEYLPIPRSFITQIRDQVKELWGSQGPLQSVELFHYPTIDLCDMNRLEFNMVMNHPFECPEFVFEDNHVVWDYFVWEGVNFKWSICFICCRRLFNMSDDLAEKYWNMKKTEWNFFHCKDHRRFDAFEMLEDVIWDLDNYCDICITQSLYRVFSEERCREELPYHRQYNSDYDSSTDEYDHSSKSLVRYTPKPPLL